MVSVTTLGNSPLPLRQPLPAQMSDAQLALQVKSDKVRLSLAAFAWLVAVSSSPFLVERISAPLTAEEQEIRESPAIAGDSGASGSWLGVDREALLSLRLAARVSAGTQDDADHSISMAAANTDERGVAQIIVGGEIAATPAIVSGKYYTPAAGFSARESHWVAGDNQPIAITRLDQTHWKISLNSKDGKPARLWAYETGIQKDADGTQRVTGRVGAASMASIQTVSNGQTRGAIEIVLLAACAWCAMILPMIAGFVFCDSLREASRRRKDREGKAAEPASAAKRRIRP